MENSLGCALLENRRCMAAYNLNLMVGDPSNPQWLRIPKSFAAAAVTIQTLRAAVRC